MQLTANTELQGGKYRIIRVLGQGGFGITYLAEHTLFDKKVAIKEFFPKEFCERTSDSKVSVTKADDLSIVEKLKSRFLKEAKHLARLDHKGIVKIHDVFQENATAFYVMDYIEGTTLTEIIEEKGAMSLKEAIDYVAKIGDALSHIHSKQMMHLDVKPSNIIIRRTDNHPILIDFGFSKQFDAVGTSSSTMLQAVSPGYSAIELYKTQVLPKFCPQTDIYSLSGVMYFLLTGDVPPSALDLLDHDLVFLSSISKHAENAIRKGMSKKSDDRYSTVTAFLSAVSTKDMSSDSTRLIDDVEEDRVHEHIKDLYDECVTLNKSNSFVCEDGDPQWYVIDKNENGATLVCDFKYLKINLRATDISDLKKNANGGNAKSQVLLGWAYEHGYGVIQNDQESLKWYEKAATKEDADGQYHLGRMYHLGNGTQKDLKEAVKLYSISAQYGNLNAMASLAWMYYNGLGTEKDYSKAAKWYEKAAENGHLDAQNMIACMYGSGKGVAEDLKKSLYWHLAAAEGGEVYSMRLAASAYYDGEGTEQNYVKAAKWYQKAAEQGNASAQNMLGNMYWSGKGVDQDYKTAVEWYQKAADQGHNWGQYNLANCYYNGNGVEKNYTSAVNWYRKAAEQGNYKAQNMLGLCYWNGEGVEINLQKSNEWFRKAAIAGFHSAQKNLADSYYDGEGIKKSYAEAIKWYTKAAEQGNSNAQVKLGNMYYHGEGVDKDYVRAAEWYRKAAEQGNRSGQNNLGNRYFKGEGVLEDWDEALKWWKKAADAGYKDAVDMANEYTRHFKGEGHPRGWWDRLKKWFFMEEHVVFDIISVSILWGIFCYLINTYILNDQL